MIDCWYYIIWCVNRFSLIIVKNKYVKIDSKFNFWRFINGLNKCGIKIDRKILAEIAYDSPEAFKIIVQRAQSALN